MLKMLMYSFYIQILCKFVDLQCDAYVWKAMHQQDLAVDSFFSYFYRSKVGWGGDSHRKISRNGNNILTD